MATRRHDAVRAAASGPLVGIPAPNGSSAPPAVTPASTNGAPAAAAPAAPMSNAALAPPPAAYQVIVNAGASKASLPASKILAMGILAGAYSGFGALLMLSVGGNCPGLAQANPGLQSLVCGLIGFPCGLIMGLLAGAELFTGNTVLVTSALIEGRATLKQLLKSWTVSYVGNVIGSLLLAALTIQAGLLAANSAAVSTALAKTSLTWPAAFVRGIMCNWLVSLAVWMATAATTLPGKVLAVMFPISAFVAIGLEHSVANMFFIPAGIMAGADITWSAFILDNLIPVTLGNIVGGAVCVSLAYAFVFGNLGK